MTDSSLPIPKTNSREDALVVLTRLREAGHVAYFAGGCVRDLLLGRTPKDWDVATDAPPERVRQLFSRTQAVGQAFGVILVRRGPSQVEVATFRTDGQYADGRRPTSVQFTTADEDAKRRDFTINGLFLDPLKSVDLNEQVIDFVGGRDDLKAGVIRAIGDPEKRFGEDYLRLLRAVRFAARLGFSIEKQTAQAIRRHASRLTQISPERVGEEMRMMLPPASRTSAWRLLHELELTQVIFRFVELPAGEPDDARTPNELFARLAPGAPVDFGLALATASLQYAWWAGPAATPMRDLLSKSFAGRLVQAMRRALKISNDESDQMMGALEGLHALLADVEPTVAMMKRFLARPTSGLSRRLLEAIGPHVLPGRADWLRGRLAELEQTEFAPPPLITGDDLTAAGFKPGPVFKRVLDAVYDEQLEGRISDRDAAMGLARSLAGG